LRFDFSHSRGLTEGELATVEAEVNAFIRQNAPVETRIMTPDDARAIGAQALFGEKYGEEVRVVSMGTLDGSGKGADGRTYSLELCGGTHVGRTGDIGAFVTLGDSASSAGVRRIEALTGQAAMEHLRTQDRRLSDVALALKAQPQDVAERVRALLDERKALQAEIAQLRRQVATGGGGAGPEARNINGIRFIPQVVSGVSGRDLPGIVDDLKSKVGSGAVLVVADTGGKAAVAAGVTADLTSRLSAVDIARAAAEALGGNGGGGRPDLAQAGGADASKAEDAVRAAELVIGGAA
jgi:alanyl-tRNA synthetase